MKRETRLSIVIILLIMILISQQSLIESARNNADRAYESLSILNKKYNKLTSDNCGSDS